MVPGAYGYTQLVQLGHPHTLKSDKETALLKAIGDLGYTLPVQLMKFPLLDQRQQHTCVPVKAFAELLARQYPDTLLAGMTSTDAFGALLERFWNCFRVCNGYHEVYRDKSGTELKRCIPIKIHTDEGTGLRKTAVYQFSWGPVMPKDVRSCNRYFYWSCLFHEQYKKHHAGFDQGNAVLDDLAGQLVDQVNTVYREGLMIKGVQYFLVLVAIEGDLPAQAKIMHCNFAQIICVTFYIFYSQQGDFYIYLAYRKNLWGSNKRKYYIYIYPGMTKYNRNVWKKLRQEELQRKSESNVLLVPCWRQRGTLHRLQGLCSLAKACSGSPLDKCCSHASSARCISWEHLGQRPIPFVQSWCCENILCEFDLLFGPPSNFCSLAEPWIIFCQRKTTFLFGLLCVFHLRQRTVTVFRNNFRQPTDCSGRIALRSGRRQW